MNVYIQHKRSEYLYPPCIYKSPDGKWWFGVIDIWTEVPENTELSDIVYLSEDTELDDFLFDFFD